MGQPGERAFRWGMYVSAAIRATECQRPERERIFDASFEHQLLPAAWRSILVPIVARGLMPLLDRVATGTPGMLFCRTRYIDDALAAWLDGSSQQVVSLGAGFDTRAYRLPGIDRCRVFELDLPTPQLIKTTMLRERLDALPKHVTYLPIDFNERDLATALVDAGFRYELKTFFIWEGVTQYLDQSAVDRTLEFVARSAPGTRIAFTYIREGIIDGSDRSNVDRRLMARVRRQGMPWIFGLDPGKLERWLSAQRLTLLDRASSADYRARFLAPINREMSIYDGEHMALASVTERAAGSFQLSH